MSRIVVAAVALLAAGCASGPNLSGNTSVACRPLTVTSAQRSADWSGTVFTIVMENHDSAQIFGNPQAPFINSLAQQGAIAAVRLATLMADGPTGGFFDKNGVVPW